MDTENILLTVGKRIKVARVECDLKQTDLADLLHVSQNTISGYESGKTEVGTIAILRLSEILNKPVSYFFEPFGGVGSVESKEMRRLGSPPGELKKAKRGKRNAA